ncbi:MAG: hypothetical protein AB9891_07750 [Anaerolineaceae bacterium]
MKPLKISLRIWIAFSSLLSFLGGWILFSHSGKPAPLLPNSAGTFQASSLQGSTTMSPFPTLQPLPSLDNLTISSKNQVQPLQSLPSLSNFLGNNSTPSLRTRGS